MTAEVDTSELAAPQAAAVEDALRTAPWGAAPSPPSGADRFRFQVSLPDTDDDHAGQVAVIDEANVPAGLQPLLDLARTRATPGRP